MTNPTANPDPGQSARDIGARLRAERERLGFTQAAFAEAVGVSKTSQFNYENGDRSPDSLYLAAAHKVGVSLTYVLTGLRESGPSDDGYVTVPVYAARASAGNGTLNEPGSDYQVDGLSISREWLRRKRLAPGSLAVITVKGHSMAGVLSDGDKVLVDISESSPKSGYIYVLRQGNELLVKYCSLMPGGMLRISSADPSFPAYDVDLSKTDDMQIIGKVVASMHEW